MRSKVFVGYSNNDEEYLKELSLHLSDIIDHSMVDLWNESRVTKNQDWQAGLKTALEEAFAVILLLSRDFLSTIYFHRDELPNLLEVADDEDAIVILAFISDCQINRYKLTNFTFVNERGVALSQISHIDRKAIWSKLVADIKVWQSFQQIDRPEIKKLIHSIRSRYPKLSPTEVHDIYSLLLDEVSKRIGSGDTLAFIKEKADEEIEINPIKIDKSK